MYTGEIENFIFHPVIIMFVCKLVRSIARMPLSSSSKESLYIVLCQNTNRLVLSLLDLQYDQ